jgi:hypothetical protein
LYRGLSVPQSRSRLCGEGKNLLALLGIEPRLLGRTVPNLVVTPARAISALWTITIIIIIIKVVIIRQRKVKLSL